MNFIVTGSILGGRGVEALATLQELLRMENVRRCLMVVWEDEAHTPVFTAIKTLPLEILVIPPPSLQASGNMTRQHLSFVSALPFFEPDDFIVRVRTDHNCRLAAIMDYLKIEENLDSVSGVDKVIVGAVSLLLPGRIEDFNYAGRRRAFDRFMWCESYFSEDYLPDLNAPGLDGLPYFSAEPELRWAGLYYAMKNPLFSFLHAKYNRYDFAFHFIAQYIKKTPLDPLQFPTIGKYLMWKLANEYVQDFQVVRDKPELPYSPETFFSFADQNLSQLIDLPNNKDIRVSCQWVVDTIAGIGSPSDQWQEFLAPAIELETKEKKSPGSVIDALERFMAPVKKIDSPNYIDCRHGKATLSADHTQALISISNEISKHEQFSTLRYAKSKLLAVRNATNEEFASLLGQYHHSGGVAGQHVDGFAAFFAVLVSKLIDIGRHAEALEFLEKVFVESNNSVELFVESLKNCTTCYASDPNRLFVEDHTAMTQKHYELPKSFHNYHLLGDFLFHIFKLWHIWPDNDLLIKFKDRLESERNFCL